MTIAFQGHIQRVESTAGGASVTVCADASVCSESIVIFVPREDIPEWLVGRCVTITMHAFDADRPVGQDLQNAR